MSEATSDYEILVEVDSLNQKQKERLKGYKAEMTIHEFGDKNKPVILLLPGTMCYWKGNFGGVIDNLSKDFLVAVVAYTGFDETDTNNYESVTEELEKIEGYIKITNFMNCEIEKYGG